MSQKDLLNKEIKLESEQLEHLKNIEKRLYRLTSMRWLFLMGLIRGFSTVIGATIVAAIVFTLLARMLSSVDQVPFLNQLIENSGIEEIVKNQVN
jgi:hypothetical protein